MSRPLPVGLIASGEIVKSPMVRFPALTRGVGPVVATSRRLAARYANVLRTGDAAELDDLAACGLIVVCGEGPGVEWCVRQLALRPWALRAKSVVALNAGLETGAVELLRRRGAAVAAAWPVPGGGPCALAVHGDARAVKAVVRWAGSAGLGSLPLRDPARYLAGLEAAWILIKPVLEAAREDLRQAGVPGREAKRLALRMAEEVLLGKGQPPAKRARQGEKNLAAAATAGAGSSLAQALDRARLLERKPPRSEEAMRRDRQAG